MFKATPGSTVDLYEDGTLRFKTTDNGVRIYGGLQDKDGDLGTSGQVLTSTGTELNWVAASTVGGSVDTTYAISAVNGLNSDEERIRLTDSNGTTDDVTLEAGTGLSIARNGDKITFTNTDTGSGTNTFIGLTDTPSSYTANKTLKVNSAGNAVIFADDNDTTYDLVTSSSGDNVQLLLDASSGDDDPILITAGTNVSFSSISATGFTINTSATLSGTIAQANTVKISTATGNEYKNITFVDRDVTNASYDSLKIDSEDDQLSYNPNANRIKTTGIQLSRIYTTSASAGTSGQVLTSGGSSGDFSWTNADSVGTDNYANSLSFGAGTLTLGRTGSLSNLTASIPLSGICI